MRDLSKSVFFANVSRMIKQGAHFKANPKVNPLEETSQQRSLRKKALALGKEHKKEHNPKRA